jgi:DNA-binding MarR family transcriptional regulator
MLDDQDGCACWPDPTGDGRSVSQALFRVARLHHLLAWQMLRAAGLHLGQELIMMRLWADGPQRPADLIRLLGSDAATVTRSVQRLERAGFVRRTPCPTDRRAIIIEPTVASQALRAKVEAIWPILEQRCTSGFTDDQRASASELLALIEQNLARMAEDDT